MDNPLNIIFSHNSVLRKKGEIFILGINERINCSLDYLDNRFNNIERLQLSVDYVEYHLNDCIKSDINQLQTIGFFASTETEMELDHSIKHALIGSYKAAFADLRRALELILISVFLSSDLVEKEKGRRWVMSLEDSPNFTQSLNKLIKKDYYKIINEKYDWVNDLKGLYWNLSDYSHNKGKLKSYRELNNPSFFSAGTSSPSIDLNTLESFANIYINTVSAIATLLALYNPIILVGLPLDTKLGLEVPISGFLYDHQSEIVHKLIPDRYKEFFKQIAENDPTIKDISQYFKNLPDLTEDDFKVQVKRQEDFLSSLTKK